MTAVLVSRVPRYVSEQERARAEFQRAIGLVTKSNRWYHYVSIRLNVWES